MKKDLLVKIFVIVYIAILIIPAIFTFVSDSDKIANTENRTLADFPKLCEEEGINQDYFNQLDSFFSDHIGFRTTMVKANTFIHTEIFGHSPEESIILGKNNWLYYEDTVKDYMGEATISKKNAENVAKSLKMIQDYVESKDAVFTFTIAPNKNTLYSDNMPWYFVETETKNNLELIEEALILEDVNYTSLKDAINEESLKSGEILYQTMDSHWNYKGALIGYKAILKSLSLEDGCFENLEFEERKDWDSDLSSMLYSDGAKKDIQLYPVYDFNYEYTTHDKAVDAIKLETYSVNGSDNALIFRDSFYNTLQVYFAQRFENVLFSRAYPYKLNLMDEVEADYVVLEIVERNLENLAKKAPYMNAPTITMELADKTEKIIVIDENNKITYPSYSIYKEETDSYIHYYGTIDEEFNGDIYYTKAEETSEGLILYKAFPIYEQELLDSKELNDNGFSFYVIPNK